MSAQTVFPLTVGCSYVVYAAFVRANAIWYLIQDDDELPYPLAYPAPLFDIISPKMSPLWQFAFTPSHSDHTAILAPEAWVTDPFFYDRLTDNDPEESRSFQNYKHMMDNEEA